MRKKHTLLAMAAFTMASAQGSALIGYNKFTGSVGPIYNPTASMGTNPIYSPTRSQKIKNKIRARQKKS